MSLEHIMTRLPLTAGRVLTEARHERRHPGSSASWVDREAMRAIDAERARIARDYTLID